MIDPDLMPGRYFNTGFIILPEGEVILKHTKNIISLIEGSTSPYDLWDKWVEKKGDNLEAFYPVVKTDIGNLAIAMTGWGLRGEPSTPAILYFSPLIGPVAFPSARAAVWGLFEQEENAFTHFERATRNLLRRYGSLLRT
ncbi:MAG: hypothetical protein JEZ12_10885 [Desulfobacterium sp.]|nr:hypothetical protein [Desulfobacterium sp.]